ncbi:MAG: BrnA antitoxin family protein [Thermodesulfobacteriota bacterium]
MRKEYDFSQGKRAPVAPETPGKVRITIRIDADILNWFREKVSERGGGNYQTMMNDALRFYTRFAFSCNKLSKWWRARRPAPLMGLFHLKPKMVLYPASR